MQDPEERRLYREVLEEELRELLTYLRDHRGFTQEEVAQRLGVSRSRISQLETAAGLSLTLETLARYAQALGLSLRLEFADESGEVLARYSLSPDEPLETGAASWAHVSVDSLYPPPKEASSFAA
ncbi:MULTISPECIES: helix-turn-helix domain-containing protein [Thermus]|uniref:helix-turn-helix domain-containing protein n=1 Tax=Thermus brockianus TaxID=56956 RepID=UPI001F28A1E1|nr:helix-turn-helix transcriptional regulator [Thermus brockianus]